MVDAVSLHAGGCADRAAEALARMGDTALPAVSRMRAVDELAALADEWLADTSVKEQARNRRTQGIITALCDYLRAPYPSEPQGQGREPQHRSSEGETTEKEPSFYTGEGETPPNSTTKTPLRQHILGTIHQRVRWEPASGGARKNAARHLERGAVTPGPWSHLVFDFSGAEFRQDTEFVGCRWRGSADLSGCTLHHVSFEGSSHLGAITFRGTQFSGGYCVFDRSVYAGGINFTGAAQASTAQERTAGEPQVSFTDCFLNPHHENYFAHPVFTGSGLPAGSRYLTPEEMEDLANRQAAYTSAVQTYHDAAEGLNKEALAVRVRNLDNAIDQWAYALTNRAAYSDW